MLGLADARDADSGIDCISPAPAPAPSLAVHAANRLMFGPKPGDIAAIESMGYEGFLAQQLDPAGIDDSACEAILATRPSNTFSESWSQLYDRRSNSDYNNVVILPLRQVREHTWLRMIHSRRQLYERMVDFWHNHFNVFGFEFIVRSMWPKWDATIRQHALGNFRQFLEATAVNPVMLYYLDNYVNTNAGTNENYARELFELHALGEENYRAPGGYVDDDVYEASRCFTGWTFERGSSAPNRGEFVYIESQHDRFQKIVLGTSIPRDLPAMADGRMVFDLLANHPGTARHIARKLARRFVSDTPSEALVLSTAAVFQANVAHPQQIRLTLQHLLSSEEFRDVSSRDRKMKRPIDWCVSVFRSLNMTWPPVLVENGQPRPNDLIYWLYDQIGQPTFSWRPPDGPPDELTYWASSNGLLRRWNFIGNVSSGSYYPDRGLDYPWDGIMPAEVTTTRGIVDWWVQRLLGRSLSPATHEALMQFVARGRDYDIALPASQISDKLKHLLALIVMTPEFQRR